MADNRDGIIVPIGVDDSGLKTGLSGAQKQVKEFTEGTNAALGSTEEAMKGAAAAADKVKGSTKGLSDQMRDAGSKRDFTRSLNVLQAAASETGGALQATKTLAISYASALGGPVLLAVTAAIGIFTSLAVAIHNASEEQKQLNADAAALHIPVEDLKNYTGAMKDFAAQLVAVQLGFGKLSETQVKVFEAYGIDPKSADAAKRLLVAISNTATDEQTKIRTYAIATGASFDEARKKWDENHKAMEKSADGFWTRVMKFQAAANLSEAGMYAESAKMSEEASQTLAQRLGANNQPSIVNPLVGSKTQEQLDQERAVQDQLFNLRKTAASARVAVMQDEVQKILAQAKIETDGLRKQKEDQLRDITDPTQRKQLGAGFDESIAAVNAAASRNARQTEHQHALDEEKAFRTQMAAIDKANDDATATASIKAGDAVRNAAQQRITALRKMLDDYFASPEFQKLNAADSGAKRASLEGAFASTSANISTTSEAQARKADQDQQIDQERDFQTQLNALVNEGEEARISVITNSTDQIIAVGQQRIDQLNQQYEDDLANLKKNVRDKEELEKKSNALRSARDTTESQIRVATAKKAADEITKPIQDVLNNWRNSQKNFSQLWAQGMDGMVDNLTRASIGMKTEWKSLVRDMVMGFIRIQIAKAAAGIFGAIGSFGGGTAMAGGTSITGATIGMAASGGNIDGPTWVGERGPEIFDPAAGRIIPNGATSAMSTAPNVTVQLVNKGTDQKVSSSSASQTPDGMVVSIFTDDVKRGGPMSSALSQAFGLKRGSR
jgi:hypothetical protein